MSFQRLKFATEATITILQIDDLIKLYPEGKDDKHGSYEDNVPSGALDAWSDFVFIYYTVRCSCLIPCIVHIKVQQAVKKNVVRIVR